jgi:hypothetical protein
MHKLLKEEETKLQEPMREVLQGEHRDRPMSEVSKERFSLENVTAIRGHLKRFNKEDFPQLPIRKGEGFLNRLLGTDGINEEIFLFVDRSGKNATQELLRPPEHGRSLCFNLIFADSEGNKYKYIVLKGVGLSETGTYGDTETVRKKIRQHADGLTVTVQGMYDLERALKDWKMAKLLHKKGVKVPLPIAIVELDEFVMADGTKTGVKEAMGKILPREMWYHGEQWENRPVIYLRAFSEVMRLDDATKQDFESYAAEQGKQLDEYLELLGSRMAENLLKIHKAGKVHANLLTHNWTMDGKPVDFDTVKGIRVDFVIDDISATVMGIYSLYAVKNVLSKDDAEKLSKAFLRDYLSYPGVKRYVVDMLYSSFEAPLVAHSKYTDENGRLFYEVFMKIREDIAEIFKDRFGENIDAMRSGGKQTA